MRSVGDSQISQSFQDGFYRGNYADLVAQTIDAHPSQIPKGSEVFIIGSLGNLGRLEEATHLFYKLKVTLSLEDRVAAKYHLGVSNTRHSQYDKAVRLFAENLQEARNSDNPVVVFYGFMGLGFYRFFCARFVRCVCAAKKALLASLDAGFTFGKYQAYELLGHAKVNIGKVAEGLGDIRRAETLAIGFGCGSNLQSFRIAEACYEVQFGLKNESDLVGYLDATPTQNVYSRSTLLLELSRVTALQGRVSKAHEYLNQASRIIYENRHKRYSSYLNFRYAYHAYLSGKFEEALNLLSAAQTNLDERVDRLLQIKILDLEQKVRLHAGVELEDCHLIESAKIKLSKESGNFIATRILARKFPHLQSTAVGRGEDPIGDLIDRGDMVSLINAGILTPIRETLGIPSGEKLIVLNVLRDTSLIVDKADIRVMNGMTKQLQAILLALSSGAHSKEQLIWKVWGYMRYDPLRHDPPLFQAIARLRNLMNPQKDWVLNTDEGYALSEGVGILMSEDFRQRVKPLTEKEPENDDVSLMVGMSRLQLARRAFGTKVFTTQQYKDVLGVSKATACRDIKDYIDARMVDKIGNGKQSVYLFI